MWIRFAAASLLCFVWTTATPAQMPQFLDAHVSAPPAGATLQSELRSTAGGTHWLGYTVPGLPERHGECGVMYLEDHPDNGLEAATPAPLFILIRIESGEPPRVRMFDPGCQLDASGLPVTWLGSVTPAESVQALSGLAEQDGSAGDGALAALGDSAGQEATSALIRIASQDASPTRRGRVMFWLGQRASRRATAAITDAIRNDPVTAVKVRAVFGLSQLPPAQGIPLLIEVAKTNANPAVRARAMFWLGQSHDQRALAFFKQVLEQR